MRHANLFEHDTRGSHYTWTNKHVTGAIHSRIDRALCNRAWFLVFPDCEIEVLNAHISDHTPLKVKPLGHQKSRLKNPVQFKFINTAAEHDDFMEKVQSSWNEDIQGRPMYILWRKLRRLQPIMAGMNRRVTTGMKKNQRV